MAFRVVLDACVLYPFTLRDTLLRFVELEAFDFVVSETIINEVVRNLVAVGAMTEGDAERLAGAITSAFPEAIVEKAAIDVLEPAMTNEPGDRHVLAAAIAGGAKLIVTHNLRHFPARALGPFGIEAQTPGVFLDYLFELAPGRAVAVVRQQSADMKRPPRSDAEILGMLDRSGATVFAEKVAALLGVVPAPRSQ